MTIKRIWVLGAPDPEMEKIEALLKECGETTVRAKIHASEGPIRVHPGNAYRADCPHALQSYSGENLDMVYRVECSWDYGLESVPISARRICIDHHNPGDVGFGQGPKNFLAASSLGQVICELAKLGLLSHRSFGVASTIGGSAGKTGKMYYGQHGWLVVDKFQQDRIVPMSFVWIAAADHCLGAAYRGECLGVDPDDLMKFRAEARASFQSKTNPEITKDVILARIRSTQDALRKAPEIVLSHTPCEWHDGRNPDIGDCTNASGTEYADEPCHYVTVRDMRICQHCDGQGSASGCGGLSGYEGPCHFGPYGPYPELPEAATRLDIGYISGPLRTPDGRKKYTCSGTAEQISAWLEWAKQEGLVNTYGDPARGFAGGFCPD